MPVSRVVKDPVVRRAEILDVAERLVATKGYERMGIQDILDELQISKGAFYHYFDSKLALLGAVLDRMQAAMADPVVQLVADKELSAMAKLRGFFSALFGWKSARKEFFLSLLRVWYSPDNAVVRQQVHRNAVRRFGPLLEDIVEQGIAERTLTISSSEGLGSIVLAVADDLSDRIAGWLLADEQREPVEAIQHTALVYSSALERMLGAPSGSMEIFDANLLAQWAQPPGPTREARE
jgi:AcrR family transcriptional regulator